MRKINNIVVHCSATKEGKYFDSKDIKSWHLQRGFKDIGYHFIILLDGTIELGRPIEQIGAHVKNNNSDSIGICYIGGGDGKDTRTIEQKASLVYLIATLKRIFKKAKVSGHRDFSPDLNKNGIIEPNEWIKLCPSFDAVTEYKNI